MRYSVMCHSIASCLHYIFVRAQAVAQTELVRVCPLKKKQILKMSMKQFSFRYPKETL